MVDKPPLLIVSLIAGLGMSAPACARPGPAFVPLGAVADAPSGFAAMCARDRPTCLAGLPATADARRTDVWPVSTGATAARSGDVSGPITISTRSEWPTAPVACVAAAWLAPTWAASGCRTRAGDAAPVDGWSLPQPFAAASPPEFALAPEQFGSTLPVRGDVAPAPAIVAAAPDPASQGTAGLKRLLKRINGEVNRHVRQRTDLETRAREEDWRRPDPIDPVGDCEDIAIEKRMRLVARGFPLDRLFYGVAFRSGYGLHTVLIARLASGDVVLDSLSPHVLAWHRTRYRWLRFQTPGVAEEWRGPAARLT